MASKNSTSTLFSSYKASKIGRTFSRNGNCSGRYIVGSVGRSCGKHAKFSASIESGGSHNEQNNRHHNVAIATQVLNPSAIGGSLKSCKYSEHFGPREDDEESFFSNKSRAVCGKVCFYGISIGVTVIMITGMIVALGYMQSEKQKISTRPVKLAQGQDFSSTTHFPHFTVLHGTTTTVKPPVKLDTNNNDIEEDDIDEIGIGDYNHRDLESENGISKDSLHKDLVESVPTEKVTEGENYDNHYDENSISNEDFKNSEKNESNTTEHSDGRETDEDERDRPFSEVRVKPPLDFKFEGVSFEIPIYRTNGSKRFNSRGGNESVPTDDNLNEGIESDGSSTSKVSPHDDDVEVVDISTSENQEETKELETSINHSSSNSATNFTSLIDSEEDNNEHEEVLSTTPQTDSDEKENYANANTNTVNTQEESSLHKDATGTTSTNGNSNYISLSHSKGSDSTNTYQMNDQKTTSFKSSSRFSINLIPTKDQQNNKDFVIDVQTTPFATLQTDIFDNEDFQASASEESGIDVDSIGMGDKDRASATPNRPHPQQYHRMKEIAPKPKGHRREKVLRPPNENPNPTNVENDDYEEDEPSKSQKRLRLKPNAQNKKFHPKENIVNHQDRLIYEDDVGSKSNTKSGTSLKMPILDYKADFSKILASTPSPAIPNTSPYPDFKFTFPSSEYDKPFNLEEYLNKHAKKKTNNVDDTSSTTTPLPPVELYTISSVPSYKVDHSNSNPFNLGSGRSLLDSSGSLGLSPFQNNQFSSGAYGSSASPTSLNLFQPQPQQHNFNFDSLRNFNLPSVNSLSTSASSPQQSFTVDANGLFSLTNPNPSNLPYPNIGSGGVDNLGLGNSFQNAFSFSADPNGYGSGSNTPILTTGSGQVPTYNTITQGIHLLTLLSGRTPDGYNNNDQHSSGSSIYPTATENNQGLAIGYGENNNWKNSLPFDTIGVTNSPVANFQTYTPNPFARKSFKYFSGSGDQDSSASATVSSFSKNIVRKASELNKNAKTIQMQSSTEPLQKYTVLNPIKDEKQKTSSRIKSLTISILPEHKRTLKEFPKSDGSSVEEALPPRSRKRLLDQNMQFNDSKPEFLTTKGPKPYKTKIPVVDGFPTEEIHGPKTTVKGLKSGFFS